MPEAVRLLQPCERPRPRQRAVRIACDDDGKRRIISEITIGLWGSPGATPDFGKLIRAARPTDGGCIGGIVDPVGLQ